MSIVVKKTELAGVTVCVRIRPRNASEKEADMAVVMRMEVINYFSFVVLLN